MRSTILSTLVALISVSAAYGQLKDTLYVFSGDSTYAYAIKYIDVEETENHTKIAKYEFDMGSTAVEIDYKRGKPCGRYKSYFPDGQLMEYGIYGWGYLHGNWIEYDEFGEMVVKGFYRNGMKDGKWAFLSEGILGNYRKGLKHGRWKYYEGNRLVRQERYKRDILVK